MKTLVHILGPGASGKSTLSRAILYANGQPQEQEITLQAIDQHEGTTVIERVKYTLDGKGYISLAGNLKNGSDSIARMDAFTQVIELCWKQRDVVIVDPVRCSKKFVNWMAAYPEPLAALFVYLDVSLETNIVRLLTRRRINAEKKNNIAAALESVLPEKTYNNMIAFRDRAHSVWTYASNEYEGSPKLCLTIPESLSPDAAAIMVLTCLEYLHKES